MAIYALVTVNTLAYEDSKTGRNIRLLRGELIKVIKADKIVTKIEVLNIIYRVSSIYLDYEVSENNVGYIIMNH